MNAESSKTLERYLKSISAYPRLTVEDETRLSTILHSSQNEKEIETAENLLIVSNLRLVAKQAIHYHHSCLYDPGVTIMDLISGGNIGLVKAVRKRIFDASKGRFSTFVHPYIKRFVIRTLLHSGKVIHRPERHYYLLQQVQQIKLEQDGITDGDIMAKLKISPFLLQASEASGQMRVEEEGDIGELLETAESQEQQVTVVESICDIETADYLQAKMDKLSSREKTVLKLIMTEGKTQNDIAKSMDLSRTAVSNIFNRALDKLRTVILRDIKKGLFDPSNLVTRNIKIPLDSIRPL